MNETMNIVFCTDRNYIQHLGAALVSLLVNNRNQRFSIFVISSGMSAKDKRNIDTITRPYDCTVSHITLSDDLFVKLATEHPMYPKGIYYRLLIPSLIDEKKLLYLDCDMIINSSIRELYDEKFGNAYVCAIEDPGFDRHQELKMKPSARYFNSGMMLINLAKWKESNLQQRVLEFIENNPDAIWFPDQCGLNSIINGEWKKVPLKFNQQSSIFSEGFDEQFDCFSPEELAEARNNPVIIHYTGGSKPWHFRNTHPYKNLYWKYLKMTPWKYAIYSDLRPLHLLKTMIPKQLKESIKKRLNKTN